MRGVQFGDHHTVEDWKLILNSKKINPPTPKTNKVEVDGRDGDLDLSEALTGEIKYNNRDVSYVFLVTEGTEKTRDNTINEIVNLIHGRTLQIIDPDDQDHYFVGRCRVEDTHNDKAYGTINIVADCEPYRYMINEVSRIVSPNGVDTDVILVNHGRKSVTPTLTVTGAVNITFGSSSVALENGTYKLSSLKLKSGGTSVTVKGTGTVVFTYREAVL